MDGQLLAGSALLLLLTISPGADMALVASVTLSRGRRAAFWTSLGITSGLPVHATVSALGLAAILAGSAELFTAFKAAGALYLAWLGIGAIRHSGAPPAPGAATTSGGSAVAAFRRGFLNNVLNPKVALFYLTFVPQFMSPGQDVLARSLLFAAIHATQGMLWLVGYAWALDRIGALLIRTGARAWLERVTGAVLVALGVRLAFAER